jgi:RsiW-degrading membrane proteinase PrsW (M82 family)
VSERRCCVCDRDVAASARPLGDRWFCAEHRARALGALSFDWSRAGLVEVALVGVFVWIVSLLGGSGATGALPTSLSAGVLLALIPTAIWLVYIYRLDRVEPEPWGLVLGVLVAGGLLGWVIVEPVAVGVLDVEAWEHRSPVAEVVASVAVRGTLSTLATYVAVRFTVYLTDELDDPLDGIVYATAAALGVVTVENVAFVVDGGVLPFEGATAMASRALVHVAAAAVLGYGMGRARFAARGGALFMGGGFAGAVLVTGGAKHVAVVGGIDGGDVLPWVTLAISLGVALVTLLAIDRLMTRLMFESLAVRGEEVAS